MLGLVYQRLIKSNNLSNEPRVGMFIVPAVHKQTFIKNLFNATLCISAVISARFALQLKMTVIESAILTGSTF